MSPPDKSIVDRSLSEPIIPKPCMLKKPRSLFRDIPMLMMMARSTTIIPVKIPVFLSILICVCFPSRISNYLIVQACEQHVPSALISDFSSLLQPHCPRPPQQVPASSITSILISVISLSLYVSACKFLMLLEYSRSETGSGE